MYFVETDCPISTKYPFENDTGRLLGFLYFCRF